MNLSENQVIEVLRRIVHPVSGKDIVTMGIVKDLKVEQHNIEFALVFKNFNDPLQSSIKKACIQELTDGFGTEVNVNVDIQTLMKPVTGSKRQYLPEVRNIIAIASGKGGVGKSTVAVNLAVAFAAAGAKTGLIDADIFGPSVPKMLKAEDVRPQMTKINGKDCIVPVDRYGVKTLSIGFFINPGDATVWRGPLASNAFQQLMRETDWGVLDYMFIDLPPGTSDIHLTLVQSVPVTGAVIVSTPQDVAMADAVKGINMFRNPSVSVPVLGLIENMSWFTPEELPDHKYYIFGKDGCRKLSEQFGIPLLGQIPLVQGIREGGDNGEPSVLHKDPVSEAFKTVADNLVIQLDKRNAEQEPTRIVEIKKGKASNSR
ncbi:MAG: Mrp/NBP35 family ATP-binding protein [Bacteroidales bacterium]|nr:Mrp/NBP35 family ATP-binding protein [Bacteroidales bacterium]